MELITPDILRKIMRDSGVSSDVESIISCESEEAVGHGENYCSNIVKVYIKVKLTSGELFSKILLLKVFLKDLNPNSKNEMKQYFANEVKMYDNILNNLEKLADEHSIINPKVWPKCYFANTDVIIFDDLREEGFIVAPRHSGLTLKDSLEVIRYLGRLHGLSIVAEKRKMINPHLIRSPYTWAELDNWSSKVIKKLISIAGAIVSTWGKEWEEPGQQIVEFSKNVSKIINDLFMEEIKLKVVNHGDAWINNFMVRYNKDNNIESFRFVDFQNATYNSYGWDLVYFLYSSLSGELMRSNYDKLLTSYRDEFKNTIKCLGEDVALVPSMDDIKSDIIRLHPFCLTVSCTIMGVVFNSSKQPINVEDLAVDDYKVRCMFDNENWKSSMKTHIKYFQQYKIL